MSDRSHPRKFDSYNTRHSKETMLAVTIGHTQFDSVRNLQLAVSNVCAATAAEMVSMHTFNSQIKQGRGGACVSRRHADRAF